MNVSVPFKVVPTRSARVIAGNVRHSNLVAHSLTDNEMFGAWNTAGATRQVIVATRWRDTMALSQTKTWGGSSLRINQIESS